MADSRYHPTASPAKREFAPQPQPPDCRDRETGHRGVHRRARRDGAPFALDGLSFFVSAACIVGVARLPAFRSVPWTVLALMVMVIGLPVGIVGVAATMLSCPSASASGRGREEGRKKITGEILVRMLSGPLCLCGSPSRSTVCGR